MTTTATLSDLHLGDPAGRDVLRTPAALDAVCTRLAGIDRLVLLGDVFELRAGPVGDRLDDAEPVLRRIAAAMRGGEVILVPGNHDHPLVADALAERRLSDRAGTLVLDEHVAADATPLARHVATWFSGTRLELRYPGVWLNSRMYATHGHYMDVHMRTPTLERLAAGALGWLLPPMGAAPSPNAYEARLAPMMALCFAAAQAQPRFPGLPAIEGAFFGLLERLPEPGRLGLGRLTTDVSLEAQLDDGLDGLHEAMSRLAVAADDVLFGHVHRSGPWPEDAPDAFRRGTARFWNPGSWIRDDAAMADGGGNWGPGAVILVEDGTPRLERWG